MKKKAIIFGMLCAAGSMLMQAQDVLDYPLDTINGEEVYRYEVERSIGLYRIGVNFNVQQADIIRLNPQLKERGLHYGETILIPTGRPVVIESAPRLVETKVTEVKVLKDTVAVVTENSVSAPVTIGSVVEEPTAAPVVSEGPDTRPVMELAIMLPFESTQIQRSGNADRMMEFYQGALLALRDMRDDSVRYRVRVYDTERSELRINALCDSMELDSVRGILGLVYPMQIERMAVWCETHNAMLLVPFSDHIDLPTHPSVLQFNSTDQQEADSICHWIKQHKAHCVSIDVREAEVASSIRTLLRTIEERGIKTTSLPLLDLTNDSASYALDRSRENLIILHSDRYQQVRILLPHLAKLRSAGYRIRILSQYSWQKENITLPQVYTSVFTSAADRSAYDTLWSTYYVGEHVSEAPRYDLLGYDLMHALIAWLRGGKETNGIQSNIRWQQAGEGGWQNANVRVVQN